eukprot:25163-Prymnesium_polylepis.1
MCTPACPLARLPLGRQLSATPSGNTEVADRTLCPLGAAGGDRCGRGGSGGGRHAAGRGVGGAFSISRSSIRLGAVSGRAASWALAAAAGPVRCGGCGVRSRALDFFVAPQKRSHYADLPAQ